METPAPSPAHKLSLLKEQIRDCIVSETFQLPLHTYSKRFNFATLGYENCRKSRMAVSLSTIGTVTRLLEIAEVVGALMEKEEFITKRNLYYKLIHYYRHYGLVDDDIELLAFNIGLEREDLRIVSSSRCLLLGGVTLHIDQTQLTCQPQLITHVSSFRTLRTVETACSTLFIVQKESALHQITQEVISHGGEPPSWLSDTIFITAKGYPDSACRAIVQQLAQRVQRVFYLGDEDIYGVDILLTYAIGFNQFATILPKITWLDLTVLCDLQQLEREYQPISKQDKAKCLEILGRDYLKDIQDYLPNTPFEHAFKDKMLQVRSRLRRMREKDKKVELESLFKFLPEGWMEKVVRQGD